MLLAKHLKIYKFFATVSKPKLLFVAAIALQESPICDLIDGLFLSCLYKKNVGIVIFSVSVPKFSRITPSF